MKKVLIIMSTIILLAMIIVNPLPAKKLGVLPEVSKIGGIYIYQKKVYFLDEKVHVDLYALNPFRYIKQISRFGAGPGECPNIPVVFLYPDYLYLYKNGKCMFFSLNGDYIREFKIPNPTLTFFAPVGKNFLTFKSTRNETSYIDDISICSYSEKDGIKHKKVVYVNLYPRKGQRDNRFELNPFIAKWYFEIFDDKVFIADAKRGLFAEIFDFNGNRISQIKLNVQRLKIPEESKKKYLNEIENTQFWQTYKNIYYVDFPEYYPDFYKFSVDKGKLYFLTYSKKGNKREIIVTDWKGKFIKRAFVTVLNPMDHFHCTIKDNKFYYLFENEESEEWELHVEDIK